MAKADAETYVERYSDMILRLSYTYLGSRADAEDICQDVLIKLLLQAPDFSSREHEKAWIIRTTINQCKDVLKSARRRTSVALDSQNAPIGAEKSAEDEALAKESEVFRVVQALPDGQRESVYLHYYEDMKIDEIAKATKQSPAAVAKQLSRARDSLRKTLEGTENERI